MVVPYWRDRSKTTLSVPRVYTYCLTDTNINKVGAPYMLMDYIHGTPADQLQWQDGSELGYFGTPEQDRKFRHALSRIQATVSSFNFSTIGDLYYDADRDDFFIGPALQTGKGPWTNSADYYDDVAHHLIAPVVSRPDLRDTPSYMVPLILASLLRKYGLKQNGPFRLANRDFGSHNVLVNAQYDIVGLNDLDGVLAAPLEVVAQFPLHCGLQVEPPGFVDTRPAVMDRVAKSVPRLKAYQEMLAQCEDELNQHPRGDGSKSTSSIANHLDSLPSSMYQCLENYQYHQRSRNDKWLTSSLEMAKQLAQRTT